MTSGSLTPPPFSVISVSASLKSQITHNTHTQKHTRAPDVTPPPPPVSLSLSLFDWSSRRRRHRRCCCGSCGVCVRSHGERTGAGNTPPAQLSTPVCCVSVCLSTLWDSQTGSAPDGKKHVPCYFFFFFFFFLNSFYASDASRRGLSQRSASSAQVRTVKKKGVKAAM